ncbi:MAG: IclR family transcriptional regulator [Salinirussus sp.]
MLDDNTGRTLKTTRTSVRVLELVREHEGLTLSELDALVDKPKSSLHAHLKTLKKCRFLVEREGTYRVGLRPFVIGEDARQRRPAFDAAERMVDRLAGATGEEANFTAVEHGRLVMIHAALAQSAGGAVSLDFRKEFYMHNTAAGKAILSELSRSRVERVLDEWGLPAETDATISTREELFAALEETAERGYGLVLEEFAEGLVAVGTSIRGREGRIVGGLSVGGPTYRIDSDRLHEELAPELLSVAEAFESELGR